MALIKHPDCGREDSGQTPACVGCGAPPTSALLASPATAPSTVPVAVTRHDGKWEALGTALVIVGFLSAMFRSPSVKIMLLDLLVLGASICANIITNQPKPTTEMLAWP